MKSHRGSASGIRHKSRHSGVPVFASSGGDFEALGSSVHDSETLDQSKLVHQEFLNVIALHPDPLTGLNPRLTR